MTNIIFLKAVTKWPTLQNNLDNKFKSKRYCYVQHCNVSNALRIIINEAFIEALVETLLNLFLDFSSIVSSSDFSLDVH